MTIQPARKAEAELLSEVLEAVAPKRRLKFEGPMFDSSADAQAQSGRLEGIAEYLDYAIIDLQEAHDKGTRSFQSFAQQHLPTLINVLSEVKYFQSLASERGERFELDEPYAPNKPAFDL